MRQDLFLCNSKFEDFFTKELIPEIEKTNPVSKDGKNRSIMGVSFGGLAAAYIADRNPNYFKTIIMQSPAFHPCPKIYKAYRLKPKKAFNIYISYGTGKDTERQDIPMIRILRDKGYTLKVDRIEGGNHEWSVWREQFNDIFIHFFGIK